ncbi:MAG: uroporphyrinogen decarboxylase [Paracoccaceae bacterium]
MKTDEKSLIRALRGEILDVPPVWMMRQAGRYLPEYRATREKAGGFLDLCYSSDLATEVTLQPVRRYGFDAAIVFADILLVPQALGSDLWFVTGEGPRLSTVTSAADLGKLARPTDIHQTLAPIYETIRRLRAELPPETALIGFAGAPWTVATYMIAGCGTRDQEPARRLMYQDPDTFFGLIDLVTEATAEYLLAQAEAGAEAIKIFDSWAGAVPGNAFRECCIEPARKIVARLRDRFPDLPLIGFPRGASGGGYSGFVKETGVDGIAIDTSVPPDWAAAELQGSACVQGNLDPLLLVVGGDALVRETKRIVAAFSGGPHIFNLGHGITPDADPRNVEIMLRAIRE